MPVSKSDQSPNKICKFCDESAHCRVWNIKFDQDILHTIKKKFPSWFSPLKIKAISSLLKPGIEIMSEAPSSSGITFSSSMEQSELKRVSPPKAIVDSSPLQTAMDRNRESLKVKLLVRRSANQLVEQGILPPLKTSPAIHEQRKLLERAKTGDLLKAKIQQRPARQELERRHILESHEGHIDPSLADKYRMLEKAILVDQLNKKILHRPGPLELIEKNILHANEPIERIVKEGLVPFKVSSEENLTEKNFLSFEDDSQSSESDLFQQSQVQTEINKVTTSEFDVKPKDVTLISQEHHVYESLPSTSGVINISLVPTNNILSSTTSPISLATFKIHNPMVESINIPPPPPPPKLELIAYHLKPMVPNQVKSLVNTSNYLPITIAETPIVNTILSSNLIQSQNQNAINQHVSSFIQNNQKFSAPGKDKNRKKCKNKAASKARAIKFHEYKGPPNKGSSSSSSLTSANLAASKKLGETNYELIMQQQCLLEYLEGIYKNPHGSMGKIEPESQKFSSKSIKIEKPSECSNDETTTSEKMKSFNKPHVTIFPSKSSTQSSTSNSSDTAKDLIITDVAKLSKMKVSELKAYLKRVNLPVSGPKPLLIERLKPYLPLKPLDENRDEASSMMSEGNDFYNSSLNSVSSAESDMDNMDSQQCLSVGSSTKDEDIVAEQQRKIEELQRKLQQSQHELEQMKQIKTVDPPVHSIDNHQLVFDVPYQMQTQLSTVFVVDVPQPSTSTSENHTLKISPVEAQILPEVSLSSAMHEVPAESPSLEQILNQERDPDLSLSQQIEKEVNASTSNVIPMSQDITDVLEILLKNGEWPEISDDGKGINSDFLQRITGSSANSNENIMAAKSFIEEVLAQHSFDVVSPMNEDTMLHSEESIDKILDTVTPSSGNFSNGYSSNHIEFPMDIEDDTPLPLDNGDFRRNMFQPSDFMEKTHQNNNMQQSFEQNHFNHNCDNQFLKSAKNSLQNCPIIKSEFPEGLQKSQSNCTKNGLIGNFDHNLFDTLKNNNINNNNNNDNTCNELFLMPDEVKFAKDDNKSLINNLHLTNNYDLFTSGLDNTAMDFESIIPYNDLQAHDSLFQIPGFDNSMNRGVSYGSFNDHNSSLLFNDDTRMSNGEMTCEVDNLLCNL